MRDAVQLRLGPCLVLSGLAYMPIQLNSFRWKNIYLTIFVINCQAASIYSRLRLLLCDFLACFVGTSTVRLREMGRDGRETYILQFPSPVPSASFQGRWNFVKYSYIYSSLSDIFTFSDFSYILPGYMAEYEEELYGASHERGSWCIWDDQAWS